MPPALHTFFPPSIALFRRALRLKLWLFVLFALCAWQAQALAESVSPHSSPSTSEITSTPNRLKPQAKKSHKKGKVDGPLFNLTDLNGRPVTDADFRGKPILLVFGYTFCPDACPTGLQNLSRILDLLGDDSDKIHALFITLDPERDTEAKLMDYLSNFHPSIVGLRGSPEQTAAAAKALRVTYAKAESVGDHDYEMDYSPILTILDAHGRLAESLNDEQSPEDMLKTAQKYMSATPSRK